MHRSDIQSFNISYQSGKIKTETILTIIRENEGFIFSLQIVPDSGEGQLSTDNKVHNAAIDIFQAIINKIGKNNILKIIIPEDDGLITYEEIVSIVGVEIIAVTRLT
jgi:hypothetical protein